jgi:hypothetical protein
LFSERKGFLFPGRIDFGFGGKNLGVNDILNMERDKACFLMSQEKKMQWFFGFGSPAVHCSPSCLGAAVSIGFRLWGLNSELQVIIR